MGKLFFALIETQGNQAYVFSSNREKAVRGASDLLFRSTTDWVIEAVSGNAAPRSLTDRAEYLRQQGPVGEGITVVVATSGRAVLLSPGRNELEEVIRRVTVRALKDAPGLSIAGAIVECDLDTSGGFDKAFHAARAQLSANLTALGSRLGRSALLPPVRPCDETGLAASMTDRVKNGSVSYQLHAQTEAASRSRSRLSEMSSRRIADSVDDVVLRDSWRAVVHTDGNGVGGLFSSLGRMFAPDSIDARTGNLNHIEGFREFSLSLEQITEAAFDAAVDKVPDQGVMPILLGGDDIIVQVVAASALEFTETYLRAFQEKSKIAVEVLKKYVRSHDKIPAHLTSCAGVAIVKERFPFSSAAHLASALLDSAKTAKDEGRASALDFHISYDSTSANLASIRAGRTATDGLRMWGGPFTVDADVDGVLSKKHLDDALEALKVAGSGTQAHALREAARSGRNALRQAGNNAEHVNKWDNDKVQALTTLAQEIDGRVLILDALEVCDITRKAAAR